MNVKTSSIFLRPLYFPLMRRPKDNLVRTVCSLENAQLNWLDEEADRRHMPRTMVIRQLIQERMDECIPTQHASAL